MTKNIEKKLREAALLLFSSNHYDDVSVARICRDAGVSNGIFYRYFKNKEAIWKTLMEEFLEQYEAELSGISGETIEIRLMNFVNIVIGNIKNFRYQFSVFREGQYRTPRYESRIREAYLKSLNFVLGRSVTEAEYIFIIGGLRFLAIRSLYHDLTIDIDIVFKIITEGVFITDYSINLSDTIKTVEKNRQLANSEELLLDAGLRLLGYKKYSAVQISDIVRSAGLSVGMFYKCFESKEQFLSNIVYRIGRLTRHYISIHETKQGSRFEKEIAGIWNFLAYFSQRRNYYSILREAEFVVPMAVKEYYDSFEHGYMKNLDLFPLDEKPIVANYLMGLSHYFGIEILFSERVDDPKKLLLKIGNLIGKGLNIESI